MFRKAAAAAVAAAPVCVLLLLQASFVNAEASFAWAQACVQARTGLEPLQACTNSMSLAASVLEDVLIHGRPVSEERQAALRAHCMAPHEHPSSCFADMAFQLGLSFQQDAAGRSAAEAAVAAGEAMCAFDSSSGGASCALKGLAALQEGAGSPAALLGGGAAPPAATLAACVSLRSAGACAVGALQALAPLAGSLGHAGAASFLNTLPRSCAEMGVRLPGAVTGALHSGGAGASAGAPTSVVSTCAGSSAQPRACPTSVQELFCGLLDDGSAPAQQQPAPHAAVSWRAVAATVMAGLVLLLALAPQPNKGSARIAMEQQQQTQAALEQTQAALEQPSFVGTPLKASASKGNLVGAGMGSPSPFARAKSAKGSMADLAALAAANTNPAPGAPSNGASASGSAGLGNNSNINGSGQAIGGDAAHLLVSHPLMSLGAPSGSADGLSAALGEIVPLPGADGEEEHADDLIPAFRPGLE